MGPLCLCVREPKRQKRAESREREEESGVWLVWVAVFGPAHSKFEIPKFPIHLDLASPKLGRLAKLGAAPKLHGKQTEGLQLTVCKWRWTSAGANSDSTLTPLLL